MYLPNLPREFWSMVCGIKASRFERLTLQSRASRTLRAEHGGKPDRTRLRRPNAIEVPSLPIVHRMGYISAGHLAEKGFKFDVPAHSTR